MTELRGTTTIGTSTVLQEAIVQAFKTSLVHSSAPATTATTPRARTTMP